MPSLSSLVLDILYTGPALPTWGQWKDFYETWFFIKSSCDLHISRPLVTHRRIYAGAWPNALRDWYKLNHPTCKIVPFLASSGPALRKTPHFEDLFQKECLAKDVSSTKTWLRIWSIVQYISVPEPLLKTCHVKLDGCVTCAGQKSYLTESMYAVVLKKSIPAQISQLILYYYWYKEEVDGFARELAFAKRVHEHFLSDAIWIYRDYPS